MYSNRKMLLLSSSRVYGSGFLEYIASVLREFLEKYEVKNIVFVPFALHDQDEYTATVKLAFKNNNFKCKVQGILDKGDPIKSLQQADGIFIGGGNTFLLLKTLYDFKLIDAIRKRCLMDGIVYIGSSAGTNVATPSISTTNDMPIVFPPSFKSLHLIDFNINPHYIDSDPDSTHQGETRELRIKQYHEVPGSKPVVGLREGGYLLVEGDSIKLQGKPAVLFFPNREPEECAIGTDLTVAVVKEIR